MEEEKNKINEEKSSSVQLLEHTEKETINETKSEEKSKMGNEEKQKEESQKLDKESKENKENKEAANSEIKKEGKEEIKTETKSEIKISTLEEAKKEEKPEKKEEKKSKVGIILFIIGILVIIIAIFSTIFAIFNMQNEKIIKGTTIEKIDVSNMTKEQAKQVLNEIYSKKEENEIYLNYKEFETTVTYKSLEVEYQINNAIEEAYSIGRKGNIFKDNIDILTTWTNGTNIKLEGNIDKDTLNQVSQNINNNLKDAVVQSSYYIEGEKLIITSGKEGYAVDEDKLYEEIYKLINTNEEKEQNIEIPVIKAYPKKIDIQKIHEEVYKEVQNAYYTKDPFTIYPEIQGVDFDVENANTIIAEEKEEYEIPLTITKPTITVKEIGTEAFPDLLAKFSTNYNAGDTGRTTNLRLAAQKITGTVLMPGEEFSYNKTVGERTIQAGYKEAPVFSNGQVVNGLGGGICQISSTLYDAVVMANLKVTTRRNHQFVTSYLPAGKDATVVWGSQDFKFVNTRKYPVRIQITVSGGVATASVWGIKEDVEYDITIETKKTATIAFTTQYVQDPSLPAGKEVVKQKGSNGSKVEAYKVMRLNGKVVSTTLLSKDTYNAKKKIVHIGTGGQ